MAAVDEHHQLDRLRPAELDQRVERGANRPPGVEHVVDQQDPLVVDGERNLGAADDRLGADRVPHQVVAVERDVEGAGGHLVLVDALRMAGEPPGERHAARADADQRQLLQAAVALEDLVRDARQRPPDAVGVHHDRHTAFADSEGAAELGMTGRRVGATSGAAASGATIGMSTSSHSRWSALKSEP